MEITVKDPTHEELEAHKKAGEEEKKENATKESVASTTPLGGIGFYDEPEPEQVQIKIVNKPAVTMLEGQLTSAMMEELNNYVDNVRTESSDYSSNLVGQIKQNDKSQQLTMDMNAPVVKGLINILAESGRKFLSTYSEDLQLKIEGDENFSKAPIDCHSIWTVHSYAGDYNPLHDHDVSYAQKSMSFSIILYCKVPPQIANINQDIGLHSNGGSTDGCTQFVWGTNTAADFLTLRPREDTWIVPKEGKFIIFPCWLKHQVSPFYGEGERRTLSANFRVPFTTTSRSTSHDHWENFEHKNSEVN